MFFLRIFNIFLTLFGRGLSYMTYSICILDWLQIRRKNIENKFLGESAKWLRIGNLVFRRTVDINHNFFADSIISFRCFNFVWRRPYQKGVTQILKYILFFIFGCVALTVWDGKSSFAPRPHVPTQQLVSVATKVKNWSTTLRMENRVAG